MPGLNYADRVQETTSTTGTGTVTLSGAVAGYQSFATAFANNATTVVFYTITDGVNWEVGKGTYTLSSTTLTRETVLASSNSGSLVNFPNAPMLVWNDFPRAALADVAMVVAFTMRMVSQ